MTNPEEKQAVVLVVDDNPDICFTLSRYLQEGGYLVRVANSGQEALATIAADPPDVVLLDVILPDQNGLEVLERLRTDPVTAELPIIMATVLNDSEEVVRGLELGANDYITKPVDLPVLLARVRIQLNFKRLQDQRRHDLQRLRELDALRNKFMQIAAHDLKNPLSQIVLGIDMLPDSDISTPEGRAEFEQLVELIGAAAQMMQDIINDFLDVQALQAGSLELRIQPTSLNELAERIARQHRLYTESKNISLELALTPDLPLCQADPDRLAQAIGNYVNNAIKFSPEGALVTIRTICGERGQSLRLEVEDQGPGISEDEIPLLFQEFVRLSAIPPGGERGSGLGLSIVKGLVELHGGRVGVESRVGVGSCFWFEIPLIPPV